jgi:hypothetical protein
MAQPCCWPAQYLHKLPLRLKAPHPPTPRAPLFLLHPTGHAAALSCRTSRHLQLTPSPPHTSPSPPPLQIMLLSDLMYNWQHREATASVGYDVTLRQCRVRGNINTAGVIQALLEERFIPGITFLLSAELDHTDKNYKFGFGFSVGD